LGHLKSVEKRKEARREHSTERVGQQLLSRPTLVLDISGVSMFARIQ
jgi:hypothetical protein